VTPDDALEARYDRGGFIPSEPVRVPMWRKDGLVSFDGPDGPWSRIIPASELKP
jgi:hypothetical protein